MAHGLFKDFLSTINSLPLIAFVLIAAILTDSLTLAQVNVEPNKALLNEGDRTELLCRYGRSINYCRIEIPGEKVLNLSPKWNKTPGFTYFGAGLAAGQCGVSIERIKAVNNGQVKCSLGVEGEELSGTIDLVVAMRPQQPIIELITKPDREGYFNEGSRFQARCIVGGGRPAANITWYIDDLPAYNKRVSRLEIEDMPYERNMTLTTIKQEIEWQLTHEDNGRKLICRSFHQTDRDSLPPQEGAFQLFVHFSPVPQQEILVYGLYLDHTAMINITINAHPTPVVEWTVDGNVIPQGTSNGRYSVYEPQYLGQDYYNVTMAIAGLTLEDTTKNYLLKASNAFGSTEYNVRISSSSTPPSSGLEIGAIVGIVVAVAVLVLIVLLIIFARATGRWCFGGKSIKTQINETTEKSAHNHGQQVALLETPNGVTIIGNKHTNVANADGSPNNNANNAYAQDRLSVLRRSNPNIDEDDSFEYATDRESSVYNPTTVPIRSVMATAGGRNSQKSGASDSEPTADGADLLSRGNQLGIPESRFSRWLPKDQREILEKQAKLLANRAHTKTPELERAQLATESPKKVATKTTLTTQRSQPQETEI